ncbi:hypothetical protein CSOJ01_07538 [Colletotrichum sojae]|uniref:Uncharacterized protein n=1 Tax=Colletotrichum sojae TaxID=2175907 RepID=A0A8H6MTG7_9PEZI|nr:hypothetical protein CSOJ01_07538 [Colletotrichum sojae]
MTATGRRWVLRAKARAKAKARLSRLLPSYRTRFDCYCCLCDPRRGLVFGCHSSTFTKSTTPARAAQDATLNPAPRPYFRPLPGRNGSPLSAVAHCHVADRHPVPTIQCSDGRGPNPTAEWILQGSTEESGSSERDGGTPKRRGSRVTGNCGTRVLPYVLPAIFPSSSALLLHCTSQCTTPAPAKFSRLKISKKSLVTPPQLPPVGSGATSSTPSVAVCLPEPRTLARKRALSGSYFVLPETPPSLPSWTPALKSQPRPAFLAVRVARMWAGIDHEALYTRRRLLSAQLGFPKVVVRSVAYGMIPSRSTQQEPSLRWPLNKLA